MIFKSKARHRIQFSASRASLRTDLMIFKEPKNRTKGVHTLRSLPNNLVSRHSLSCSNIVVGNHLQCFMVAKVDGSSKNYLYLTFLEEINLDKLPLSALHTAMQMWNDACLIDARVQIGGLCMIMDLSDLRREMLSKMFDAKISKLSTKYFQEGLPFRIKKLIYYNTPKMFEAMFKIYSEWLNEKIKSRIMVLNADMNPAFDAVPGLKEIVPEAFGGDCKLTFEEICEREAPTFKSLVEHAPHFEITVDESKRPKECRNLMGTYKDLSEDVMGKVGTYVKLNQDEI